MDWLGDLAVELLLLALDLRLRLLGGRSLGLRLLDRRRFADGLAERALEVVERNLARAQLTLQDLLDQRADRLLRLGLGSDRAFHGHLFQLADQVAVGAFRLLLVLLEFAQDFLEPVDGRQDQRHRIAGHWHAVAELTHERLSRMGERFQPGQAEKAAGPLDGVD